MAYTSKIFLVLVVLVVIASSTKALIFDGKFIEQVRVRGQLFCSATGNRNLIINSRPLVGANVSVVCSGQPVVSVATNGTGLFEAVLTSQQAQINIFGVSNCIVTVELPVSNCALLPRIGRLRASLNILNVLQTSLGNVLNVEIRRFNFSLF